MDAVSSPTRRGSDRVGLLASAILLSPETRSLPLPVLTPLPASQIRALPTERKACGCALVCDKRALRFSAKLADKGVNDAESNSGCDC
jgi:hypothetical protein